MTGRRNSAAWLYNTKFTSGDHLWYKFVTNNFVYTWQNNDVDEYLESI